MKQFNTSSTTLNKSFLQVSHKKIRIKQMLMILTLMLSGWQAVLGQNVLDKIGLDAGTSVEGAYSVRQLSTGYLGYAIKVRKTTAAADTLNIGFTASGDLDTTSLMAFAGSSDIFVTKWYDQSGKGKDIVQINTNNQPRIIIAGVLQKNEIRPAIFFDGDNDVLSNPFTPFVNYPISMSLIASTPGTTNNGSFVKWGGNGGVAIGIGDANMDNSSPGRNLIILKESVSWSYSTPSNLLASSATFSTILTQNATTGTTRSYYNGNNVTLNNPNSAPRAGGLNGALSVGGYGSRYPVVRESELIIFSEILSLDKRTILECNQFTYYNLKLIPNQTITVCSGETFFINPTGDNFSWGLPGLSGAITGATTGSAEPNFSQTLFNSTGSNQTATYLVTPACKGASFTITVTVKPFAVPSIDIAKDFCSIGGGKVILKSVPATFSSYLWSNGATQDSIIIEQSGIYRLTVTDVNGCKATDTVNIGNELVKNGDFSMGVDSGYVTDYIYTAAANGLVSPGIGYYSINTNAKNTHGNFWGFDHTTGNGNFMIINGDGSTRRIWEDSVTVQPNTKYYFSAWAMSVNNAAPFGKIQFSVNGINVGSVANLVAGVNSNSNNGWQRFFGSWESDTLSGNIAIRIVNLEAASNGNDFALDDISFSTLPPVSFLSVTLGNGGNSVCTGGTLQLTSNIQGGTSPIVYSWTDPIGDPLTAGNDVLPNPLVNSPISGLYSLSAVDGAGCPANASIDIVIGNPTVGAVDITKKCIPSLEVKFSGMLPNVINNQIYYYIKNTSNVVRFRDTALVNSNNAGESFFVVPFTSAAATDSLIVDSIFNGSCAVTLPGFRIKLTGLVGTSWIGPSVGNWDNPANWCPGIPTTGTTISFPTNTTINIPDNYVATIGNLSLNAANTRLILGNNATLRVFGDFNNTNNTSKIDARLGTFELKRNGNTNLNAVTFVDTTIKTLILAPSTNGANRQYQIISTGGAPSLIITESLEFNESTVDLITNGKLILSSRESITARVGILAAGNSINGDVIVERYISAGRKWRFLSVPVAGTLTFKQAWQEGAATAMQDPKPGYGFVLGSPTNAIAQGFDVPTPGGPTVKTYNPSNNTWTGIASTNDQMQTNEGYMVFIGGNRTVLNNAQSTIARTRGTLKQKAQSVINVPEATFVSIGNPYASPLSIPNIDKTNIQDVFYVWDPKLGGSYGLGGYQTITYDVDEGVYFATPGGGSYPQITIPLTPVNNIESGQAFFVRGNNIGTGSVLFTEDAKSAGAGNLVFRIPRTESALSKKVVASLWVNQPANLKLADAVLTRFADQYSNTYNDEDVLKIANTNENLSIENNNRSLVIDNRNTVSANDTIHLKLSGVRVQNYLWKLSLTNMEQTGLEAFLIDKYLQTNTPLLLGGETEVNFNISNIPASYASDRFKIVFKQQVVLPVTITSISANRNNDKTVAVQWKVDNELNLQNYQVERSSDGRNFTNIKTTLPEHNAGGRVVYNTIDDDGQSGDLFYRIKANSISGQVQYSAIVKVSGIKTSASISVYPNPVTGKQMQVRFTGVETGNYQLVLVNAAGQIVYKGTAVVNNGASARSIQLSNDMAGGRYHLTVTAPDGTNYNQIIIME